jgi:hypothetical protein
MEKQQETKQKDSSKKRISPKLLIWIGVLLTILIATVFFMFDYPLVEQEKEVETSEDDTEIVLTEEEEEEREKLEEQEPYITWESMDIPPVYPEYTDGQIGTPSPAFEWMGDGVSNFVTVYNTSENTIKEYVDQAVNAGWELVWAEETQGDEDNSWALSKEEDEVTNSIVLNWYSGENSYLTMILTSNNTEE